MQDDKNLDPLDTPTPVNPYLQKIHTPFRPLVMPIVASALGIMAIAMGIMHTGIAQKQTLQLAQKMTAIPQVIDQEMPAQVGTGEADPSGPGPAGP